jgi:hypothetical protein
MYNRILEEFSRSKQGRYGIDIVVAQLQSFTDSSLDGGMLALLRVGVSDPTEMRERRGEEQPCSVDFGWSDDEGVNFW